MIHRHNNSSSSNLITSAQQKKDVNGIVQKDRIKKNVLRQAVIYPFTLKSSLSLRTNVLFRNNGKKQHQCHTAQCEFNKVISYNYINCFLQLQRKPAAAIIN